MAERTYQTMLEWLDIDLDNLSEDEKVQLITEIYDRLGALQLRQLRDLAEEKRKEKLEDAKTEVLIEMRGRFEELGLSLDDVFPPVKQRKTQTIAVKYRSPNDETWSGRGFAPNWLRKLEEEGHDREEYKAE